MTHIQDEALADTIVSVLRPYAARIELYGSHARGEARPDSDIDILVELRPQDERPSKEKRSSQAKVAPQIADKGYCSSKCVSYHGVKLHVVAQKRSSTLPLPAPTTVAC